MEFFLRNKIRPLFAFLLVTAFLVLSYCPLRRAIQDVLGGSTRTQAKELGPRNIRVNSINPGLIETEGSHSSGVMKGDAEKWHISETPLGRVGKPEDIAKVSVFLASDDSYWITGETIAVAGGQR